MQPAGLLFAVAVYASLGHVLGAGVLDLIFPLHFHCEDSGLQILFISFPMLLCFVFIPWGKGNDELAPASQASLLQRTN